MTFRYRNLKHVELHGIPPFGEKEFDHEIEGGGIELIEESQTKKVKSIKTIKGEV